jgi:hypothetical protein
MAVKENEIVLNTLTFDVIKSVSVQPSTP